MIFAAQNLIDEGNGSDHDMQQVKIRLFSLYYSLSSICEYCKNLNSVANFDIRK